MAQAVNRKQAATMRLIELFRTRGFAGASLSDLAAATGLGRASLYHHFPGGKDEMGHAALALAGGQFAKLVLAPLDGKAPARERLLAMLDGVGHYYAADPPACLMNAMAMGGDDNPFREPIAKAVAAWLGRIERCFAELGLAAEPARNRAEAVVEALQGALILARLAGERGPLSRCLLRLRAEMTGLPN